MVLGGLFGDFCCGFVFDRCLTICGCVFRVGLGLFVLFVGSLLVVCWLLGLLVCLVRLLACGVCVSGCDLVAGGWFDGVRFVDVVIAPLGFGGC